MVLVEILVQINKPFAMVSPAISLTSGTCISTTRKMKNIRSEQFIVHHVVPSIQKFYTCFRQICNFNYEYIFKENIFVTLYKNIT